MKELPIIFRSGGEQVVGMLHLPKGASARRKCPAVVFLHGFTGSRHEAHRLFVVAARRLAGQGMAALRFDFRGSGDSAGDFSEMTISRELEDARSAVRWIRKRPEIDPARVALLGMSMGGMVSALLLGEDSKIPAAVLWCPVADFERLVRANQTIVAAQSDRKTIDFGGWPVGRAFIGDGLKQKPVEVLARSRAMVLILHGDADQAVPVNESTMYRNAARREIIPGADHTFNSLAWTERVVRSSASWLRARLSSPARGRRASA
jgi:uncharacterized protein